MTCALYRHFDRSGKSSAKPTRKPTTQNAVYGGKWRTVAEI